MAPQVLTNGYTSINASDLSSYCKKIQFDVDVDEVETTAFSAGGWKSYVGGLKVASFDLTFNGDYAAGLLDAILWPLLGTVVAFEFRPVNTTVSTSNPKWTGSLLVSKLTPISGSIGDLVEVEVTWPSSGTVARATA